MALTFELLRPDDLLALRVDAFNLKLDGSQPQSPKLVIENPKTPAYLVVRFPPQSIIEKAYFETVNGGPGSDPLDPAGSVPVRMSGGSRLVFQLPKNLTSVPFSMAALLDWSTLDLVLSATATGQLLPPPIVPPTDLQTGLELPYRIILSPADVVGWLHASTAVTHAGRTELWHTRLGKFVTVKTKTGTQQQLIETDALHTVPLRAIWSPDFVDHGSLPSLGGDFPFQAAMSPRDRAEMVILTSGTQGYLTNTTVAAPAPWVPKPIQASRVFLSALGGWLSSRGSWPQQPFYNDPSGQVQQLDISEWDYIATQGRDHYVRIVYEGFLYPFGHRAALIKVTERKIVPADGGAVQFPTAYLRQHEFIVVREKEKAYPTDSFTFEGREMPFWQSVKFETLVTPYIDKPSLIPIPKPGGGTQNSHSFWINVNGGGFPFHVTAVDLAGKAVNFITPLIFMDEGESDPTWIRADYTKPASPRICLVKGSRVAYADPTAGDTTLKTNALFFDTELLKTSPPYPEVPFIPILDQAEVTVPALEKLLGTTTPTTIQLYGRYLSDTIDAHAGVFAQIAGTAPTVVFSADKAGGFATPNLTITALSARKGIIAGSADDAADGLFRPSEFFADLSAKLFGSVPLQALIPVDGSGTTSADVNAPTIKSTLSPDATNPETETTLIAWSPRIQAYSSDNPPVELSINQGGTSVLTLNTKLVRSFTGAPPQSAINGELSFFRFGFDNVVAINFNSLKFSAKNGEKLNVKADLPSAGAISFEGPLAFVQKLAEIIPPGLFGSSGPSVTAGPDAIKVSLTIAFPSISVGVFSLEHISFMTGLDLPYLDGKPALEFAFAKRSAPFLILVECLGGGGFVHLVVDADGVQMVEGALEFGGEFAIDLGVASGGVHIMAGIYFKLSGTESDLTGFVDIGGEVSVLGIISISIDLNLSLTYQVKDGKKLIVGRATLTISVHIIFFSISVQLSVERSFKADSGDPRIDDLITPADWSEYAAAFAA